MVDFFGFSSPQTFTPLTISSDALSGWYLARANAQAALQGAARTSSASAGAAQAKSETPPPWDPDAPPSPAEELARRALATGVFVDTEDLEGYSDTDAPQDHKQLFALHQALKKLQAIASGAAKAGENDGQRLFLDRRFQEGLDQITNYLATATFDGVRLAAGEPREKAESGVAIPRGENVYRTSVIHDGAYDDEVAGFQGSRAFTITVSKLSGANVVVDIDLADMGATPRTLDNVADFINAKLDAAGLAARFKRYKIGEPDENGIVQGSRFGFEISGIETEKISFSASASASGAVYLAGTSGRLGGEDGAAAGQLTKISGLDDVAPTTERSTRIETAEAEAEADGLAIRATAIGPDGGIYVLGATDASLEGGPELRGEQDAVLVKYDSTGHRVWSRVLGAAESAEGRSLAVGPDGSVTVAGVLKGELGETIDRGGADAFVARFSATGVEEWTHRFGGIGEEAVDGVAVGADGTVYVAGRTGSPLAGAAHGGGVDGFVRAISTSGAALWTRQFGGSGDERASAIAIADDGDLLVGSVEDGAGFLRKYSTADGTSPALWEHALGDLDEGSINAIHADATGIYLTGAARSGFTLAGSPVAHAGARDAFVIALDDGASPSVRFETFLGSESEDVAKDIVVLDGAVYVAGYTDGALPGGGTLSGARNAFAAKFDATTGALDWTTQIAGRGGRSEAAGLVADASGASDLDAFGLPTGALVYQDERTISQRTSARAGDYFYISVNGGHKRKITIDADDTLRALTFKISTALVLDGEAKVVRTSEGDRLRITPKEGVSVELIAGGEGGDLLAALGLEPGVVTKPGEADGEDAEIRDYGLKLNSGLSISDRDSAQAATAAIETAMSTVRAAYRYLTRDPALDSLLNGAGAGGGPAPAHILAQIANYQNALARLGGL